MNMVADLNKHALDDSTALEAQGGAAHRDNLCLRHHLVARIRGRWRRDLRANWGCLSLAENGIGAADQHGEDYGDDQNAFHSSSV